MAEKEFVEKILKKVADKENIENFELIPDVDVYRGDGFLSEFYTGSVKNRNTGQLTKVYIKIPPKNDSGVNINDVYSNECRFYLDVWPALDEFQREKGVNKPFDKIPNLYDGDFESERKYLALENLKAKNYTLHNKKDYVNHEHLTSLFENYGKFHALSFAFKDQNAESYRELTGNLVDIFPQFMLAESFAPMLKKIFDVAINNFEKTNEALVVRVRQFKENFENIVSKVMTYRGEYSTLTHGDCWSNNMLFKYDAQGNLDNLKLLDFQLIRNSTPVHDLSYFFYSGACKQDLDKVDEYLNSYYRSFSTFAKELGSDPEKLYPFKALEADWTVYSILGMILALMIWQVKFISREAIEQISDGTFENEDAIKEGINQIHEIEEFKESVCNIFLHAIERNIL